jgi:hypothetical protein
MRSGTVRGVRSKRWTKGWTTRARNEHFAQTIHEVCLPAGLDPSQVLTALGALISRTRATRTDPAALALAELLNTREVHQADWKVS